MRGAGSGGLTDHLEDLEKYLRPEMEGVSVSL